MNNKKLRILTTVLIAVVGIALVTSGFIDIRPQDDGYNISINLPDKKEPNQDLPTETPADEEFIDGFTVHYVNPLSPDAKSNTQDGSVKYGATIVLGELDDLGRSTFAHMRLKDENEPGYKDPATGQPREKRNERINVDPAGWLNFKIDGKWANNRCHLLGYQFSGLNDELRNLATCTSYLNKGSEGSGTDMKNVDGMLYYEQLLDKWLADNPDNILDYYVKPIYDGSDLTPYAYYLQWVGYDASGNLVDIDLGGHSEPLQDKVYAVLLENMSPSYNVDTTTGIVTKK